MKKIILILIALGSLAHEGSAFNADVIQSNFNTSVGTTLNVTQSATIGSSLSAGSISTGTLSATTINLTTGPAALTVGKDATIGSAGGGLTISGNSGVLNYDLRVLGNKGVDMEGSYDGSGQSVNVPIAKSSLIWLPKKGAFRVGYSSYAVNDSEMAPHSFAFGGSRATAWNSFAAGGAYVPGANAVGMGGVTAQAGFSFVVGSNNIVEGTPAAWNSWEPLFVVGNGMPNGTPSNALTIYKNGAIKIQPQGDISMGMYGN